MKFSLKGRLRNTNLSPASCLLPLFEAISNSLHAINERDNRDTGTIRIEIHRDQSQKTCFPMGKETKIKSPVSRSRIMGLVLLKRTSTPLTPLIQ